MTLRLLLLSACLVTSPAIAQTSAAARINPAAMTAAQIKAHNATVDRKHASYIRCRSADEIGSLVKKIRTCRTNAQWAGSFLVGNQDARDTVDAMSRAPMNQ